MSRPVIHYTVTRTPLDPYAWYEQNKDELKEACHPAEMMRVECSFANEDDAAGFCDVMNIELYVDTYWKSKLTETERKHVKDTMDRFENPMDVRRAFLAEAARLLQLKLAGDVTIPKVVENMPGGYSYCSMEHFA